MSRLSDFESDLIKLERLGFYMRIESLNSLFTDMLDNDHYRSKLSEKENYNRLGLMIGTDLPFYLRNKDKPEELNSTEAGRNILSLYSSIVPTKVKKREKIKGLGKLILSRA